MYACVSLVYFLYSLACNCTEHGSCDEGPKRTGSCFCEEGWTGPQCENKLGTDLLITLFVLGLYNRLQKDKHYFILASPVHSACISDVTADGPVCNPTCNEKAVCMENNTCVCKPFYEGDGITCTGTYMMISIAIVIVMIKQE